MHIAVVGLSHKTAPVEVREKLSIPELQTGRVAQQLGSCAHLEEIAILSTCNRLEIYLITTEAGQGTREALQFLVDYSKIPAAILRPHLFVLLHQDAVMHLMRVAAGLDSLVLGEGQILAQVKQAHKLAQQSSSIGRGLNQLFKQALVAGKRVRTETSIGTGAVSISSAAVELAQIKVHNLAHCRATVVGAGKMAHLLVKHLLAKGATHITIINRSLPKAQELADQFRPSQANGKHGVVIQVGPMEEMIPVVAESRLVFTSTAAPAPILNRAQLEPFLHSQRLPMLFDIAVPRNVDTDLQDLVPVFNVDDLKAVVVQNQESRRQMAQEAQGILEAEVASFESWWSALDATATISSLREKVETIRAQELEKALSRLGSEFAEKHQEVIEALTRGIVNKILHDPMVQLRAQQDVEARRQAMQTLEMLFNLPSSLVNPSS